LTDYDTAPRIASTQALTAAALDYRPPRGTTLAASQQGRDFTSEVQFLIRAKAPTVLGPVPWLAESAEAESRTHGDFHVARAAALGARRIPGTLSIKPNASCLVPGPWTAGPAG